MYAFDNKWVQQILSFQQDDGSWGHFHTLSQPTKKQPMTTEPEQFASRKASRYLSAMELLSDYSLAPEKLSFVVDWLKSQQDDNGLWDMGSTVKDGIHFPLSDSWHKTEDRKRDCTSRVLRLLDKLEITIDTCSVT